MRGREVPRGHSQLALVLVGTQVGGEPAVQVWMGTAQEPSPQVVVTAVNVSSTPLATSLSNPSHSSPT